LEACTASLPPEAVELDAQREAAAVAAVEPVAQQQAEEVVVAPDVQQEVAAVAPDAQQQEEVMAAQSGLRRPEPSVESAAVRLWFQATSSLVVAPE